MQNSQKTAKNVVVHPTIFAQCLHSVHTGFTRTSYVFSLTNTCKLRVHYVGCTCDERAMYVRWTDDGSAMRGRCDEEPLWSHCGQRMLRNVTPCYAKNAIHRSKKQESVYLFRKIAYVAASEALQTVQYRVAVSEALQTVQYRVAVSEALQTLQTLHIFE